MRRLTTARSAPRESSHAAASKSRGVVDAARKGGGDFAGQIDVAAADFLHQKRAHRADGVIHHEGGGKAIVALVVAQGMMVPHVDFQILAFEELFHLGQTAGEMGIHHDEALHLRDVEFALTHARIQRFDHFVVEFLHLPFLTAGEKEHGVGIERERAHQRGKGVVVGVGVAGDDGINVHGNHPLSFPRWGGMRRVVRKMRRRTERNPTPRQ